MMEKQISACYRHDATCVVKTTMMMATMLMITLPAFAGLGENVSSVQADQAHMQGSLRSTQSESYTLHEITAASGVVVREYVSAATGKVFAVAWQGAWPPDMRQVLATYFASYQQAAQTQANLHGGRRPLVIHQPGLVVESGGHMRSFAGRAYIPDMLPEGVKAEVIR
ncbi:MAG TPA: DUF2844 domain-containing protein [Terriglobales bacterium]|jgi:hypothetical protein|nr:DUF2844 domain-containing protein [Terriglobales bacterium]